MKTTFFGTMTMIVLFSFAATPARATVITPASASTNSQFTAAEEGGDTSYNRQATNTINSSGLIAGQHSTSPTDMWESDGSVSVSGVYIEWDLGGLYSLTGFHMWNYNEAYVAGGNYTNSGVHTADIQVSANGSTWTDLTPVTPMGFTQAPGTSTYTGEDYSLVARGVEFIKFSSLTNFDGPNYVGISEIRFDGVALPEPTSYVMLSVAAVGLLGAAYRRRSASKARA